MYGHRICRRESSTLLERLPRLRPPPRQETGTVPTIFSGKPDDPWLHARLSRKTKSSNPWALSFPNHLLDICAALTGRVPASGLHLDENRGGQLVFDLAPVPGSLAERDDFYPVLGHLVGQAAGDKVPVIVGLAASPNENQLKALAATAASSGSVGLFHIVGVTPEAPTLEDALRGKAPAEHDNLSISVGALRRARKELTTAIGKTLELIILGSPHFSLDEFRQLAPLLEGKKRHPDVSFLVTTSRIMRQFADAAGLIEPLTRFGGRLTVDTCILATPMLSKSVRTLMTNSGKYALYSPGLLDVHVAYGSLEDCIQSAVAGKLVRSLPWCTTRDLGPQLSCTHGFEVPHEHFQTHSAEVCEEGLSREELA